MADVDKRSGEGPTRMGTILRRIGGPEDGPGTVPEWLDVFIERDGHTQRGYDRAIRRWYKQGSLELARRLAEAGLGSREELEWLQVRDAAQAKIEAMGTPRRLWDASQYAGTLYPAADAACAWASAELLEGEDGSRGLRGRCLVLSGPSGIGKSWAAVAAVRFLLEELGTTALWGYAGDMLSGYRPEAVRYSAEAQARILVVDDLGTEDARDKGKWDTLIYRRHGAGRTTIITTNLSLQAFADKFGSRVGDRLREWAEWRTFGGESKREATFRRVGASA